MPFPELLIRQRETIRYDARLQAIRVCPFHKLPLDDNGSCQGLHTPDYWEVRYRVPDGSMTEPVYRASWDDIKPDRTAGISRDPASGSHSWRRPDPRFNPNRKCGFINETSYRLRKAGMPKAEAKRVAEERWAKLWLIYQMEQRERMLGGSDASKPVDSQGVASTDDRVRLREGPLR